MSNKVKDEVIVRVTNHVRIHNPLTGETVTVDISNTKFRLCLVTPSGAFYSTGWTAWYEGVLTLPSQVDTNIRYGYATAYWDGSLPIEKPFIIQEI